MFTRSPEPKGAGDRERGPDYHGHTMSDTEGLLRTCALFSRLSPEDRRKVAEVSVVRRYEKGGHGMFNMRMQLKGVSGA